MTSVKPSFSSPLRPMQNEPMSYPIDALDAEYNVPQDTEVLQPPSVPLVGNDDYAAHESLTDSPPPHQVVDLNDMWWLDEQMQQLDVSVDEPAADDESPQFYARLNRMLAGPGYADGRSASKLPILSSHQEDWDLLQWVEPIVEGQTAKEQEFILSFGDAWRRNARALRKEGSQSTPIEDEMCLVLTLLSASISSLARAVMRQDRGGEKRIIQSMEMAIEGFSLLSRIDRQARQKCRASTEDA